ncbi:MAG: thioesterase family protein [Lutimonas sp.]
MSLDNRIYYSHKIRVMESDLDSLNHVNNVVYLQWVNDISEKHWNLLADQDLRSKYFWVVLRHEIDYMNQAVLGDQIKVVTWVGASKGVRSIRHVEMFVKDKPLVKASSTWCLIDAKTLRPTRIREDILDLLTG